MLRIVVLTLALSANANETQAQPHPQYGKCGFWLDHTEATQNEGLKRLHQGFRLGYAHGFVAGMGAELPSGPPPGTGPYWDQLVEKFYKGYAEALQRPALIVDALDAKCGDYRNRGVYLNDLGFVALLEVGGVPSPLIERVLELMRAGDEGYKQRAVALLTAVP